jgi:hypothetical protein
MNSLVQHCKRKNFILLSPLDLLSGGGGKGCRSWKQLLSTIAALLNSTRGKEDLSCVWEGFISHVEAVTIPHIATPTCSKLH